jgi:hypothetical protein
MPPVAVLRSDRHPRPLDDLARRLEPHTQLLLDREEASLLGED